MLLKYFIEKIIFIIRKDDKFTVIPGTFVYLLVYVLYILYTKTDNLFEHIF